MRERPPEPSNGRERLQHRPVRGVSTDEGCSHPFDVVRFPVVFGNKHASVQSRDPVLRVLDRSLIQYAPSVGV
ncbi:uncharacterized protein NP_6116A (plasmid) [Natronomonas pharaonis DSM 2160]|uniref:Uncharacterized protein n=1 Tax=Natronomonas pharaonis (strain ATCC 35678 / DSM 2160 / CIP 103997 / JCM 8858 / NBRC 14720 / NCIMB 2260 / Gabara) TaxID=348780 RepID=Q3IM27_NATPD|nr:uncharacterized protein NP_6116A [Natronomonas pharaonis DSM 2160]